MLKVREVGHTGTLDPFATGLLVILVGKATRLARFVEQQAKTYLAQARLGVQTTTDDLTGDIVVSGSDPAGTRRPSRPEVVAAVAALVGEQQQRPPAFSAKKVGGERSHRLARRGRNVELAPTQVTVYTMDLLGFDYPDLEFRTTVSAGTYVRALARDLGAGLGCGGHLTGLRRESIGQLRVESALTLDAITPGTKLLPALAVVAHLARVDVSEADATNIGFGRAVELRADHAAPASESPLALVHQERLIGIGRVDAGKLQPEVVLEAAG